MGLQERRMIQTLQQETLPARSAEIAEICGQAVPYEVDWDSLGQDGQALNFVDNTACHRLNMALRVICLDEMGKQAVREGLKQVKLVNVATPELKQLRFANGVLEIHNAFAHGAQGMHSDGEIRAVLEAGL
ncbi:hypothetical protein [Inhella proteolytica]|uniref:Uncharacterized protein n=1 Tax=Inhella proteolytica TaxID=2795029 RepID=A0A931NIU9_9BURK|nr:hypothetical protein [Inhella proteolytica]MBH9579243.1 hypothetical protein [Inhella proteolytica]